MPDIGLGELIVIAVLGLLVFGDRLPGVAADAARALRQVRQMATTARRDLADAAGLQDDPALASAVRDLRDLDPRRVLEPLEAPGPAAVRTSGAGAGAGAGAAGPAGAAADDGAADDRRGEAAGPAAAVDHDWT